MSSSGASHPTVRASCLRAKEALNMSIAKDKCQPTRGSLTQGMTAPAPSPQPPGPCNLLLGCSFPPERAEAVGDTRTAWPDLHHPG